MKLCKIMIKIVKSMNKIHLYTYFKILLKNYDAILINKIFNELLFNNVLILDNGMVMKGENFNIEGFL